MFGPSNELRFEDPGALFRPEELWLRQGKRVRMAGVSSFEGSRFAVFLQGKPKFKGNFAFHENGEEGSNKQTKYGSGDMFSQKKFRRNFRGTTTIESLLT